jgi:hypothetical protein
VQLTSVRVLGICIATGFGLGVAGGTVYALIADKLIVYGMATGLLVLGLVALALGLLGATEPPEGWSLKRRAPEAEDMARRSLAARAAYEPPRLDNRVSSIHLALWGIVVGGSMVALSLVLFEIAR